MKKAIFIFVASVCCLNITGFSQKVRVGVSAGMSFANISRTIGGADKDGEYRLGLISGLQLEVPLYKKITFQPALHYFQKGADEISTTPNLIKIYTALRYAEIDPNFVYNFKAGKGVFYLGGGPYLSFNLPSKKVTKVSGSNKVESDVLFGNAVAQDMKGVDYGGNVLMGVRIANGMFVSAQYTQGARNLVPDDKLNLPVSANDKMKNIAFALKVGYLFPEKPHEQKVREKKKRKG